MRVPNEFTNLENLEIGVDFKSNELGSLTTTIMFEELEFAKPPMASFFKGLSEKDVSAVITAYEKAGEYYSDDANYLNAYAWVLVMAKDKKDRKPKKAIELAEKAVEISEGSSGAILDTLAVAYYQNSQLEKAVETINKAVKLSNENGEIAVRATKYRKELKNKRSAIPVEVEK